MKKGIYMFLSYLYAFGLGIYTGETINGASIEPYRWALASFFALFFLIGAHEKKSRNG